MKRVLTEAKVADRATCTGNAGGPPLIASQAAAPLSTPSHIKDKDLNGLNAHQKDLALELLIITEEADSFARDDSDVSCIKPLFRRTMWQCQNHSTHS